MIRKIIATVFSKGLTAICSLLTLLLTANYLGAEGRGEMALFVLGVSIVGLFQAIFSGAVLTYLTPKFDRTKLLVIASIWNVLISFVASYLLVYFNLFAEIYLWDLIGLSLILGFITMIQSILLGVEAIYKQNVIEITKAVSTALCFVIFLVLIQNHTILAVIYTFYIAYGLTFLLALVLLLGIKQKNINNSKTSNYNLISQFLRIGTQMQMNNISQMINYRFCYYLIEKKLGLSALGIFSVAVNLIEVIWVICKSISSIHYSKSVNLTSILAKFNLTQKLTKMSLILTLPALVILLLIPDQFIAWVLGKDFINFKLLFLSLAPGVLALAGFTLFNHYFSSVDKNLINLKASLLGNLVTISVSLLVIDYVGILSGGIATSIGYCCMFIYLFWRFNKDNQLKSNWLTFSSSSIKESFDLKEFENGKERN